MCFLCECVFTTFFEEKKMSGLGCCERKVDIITLGVYDESQVQSNMAINDLKKDPNTYLCRFDLTFILF